jgi:hypothetical protein
LVLWGVAFLGLGLSGCALDPYCLGCLEPDGAVEPIDAGTDGESEVRDAQRADRWVCVPTGASEVCDGIDDDCDGRIDEDFDRMSDPRHCGACGNECRYENGEGRCEAGRCVFVSCLPGYVDLDGNPGCEYACPVFPVRSEDCNGFDDDCDGAIDEPEDLPPAPLDLCRTTPGTPCAGVVPVCTSRAGRTTWYCDYPREVEFDPLVPNGIALEETRCDGYDGDCDGLRDESFEGLGTACDNGGRGACRDEGVIVCDPRDPTRTICDLSVPPDPVPGAPSPEVCNGIDDDCDGTVDNSDPSDPRRVRDDMVHVVVGGLDFWIYRHEASRPDATATSAGRSSARACGRGGVLPWTSVGHDEAAAACRAAGHRLCTGAEWQAACEGAARTRFPYGNTYEPSTCNGAARDAIPGGPIDSRMEPTGTLSGCRSSSEVFDLSGNAKEWTEDPRGTTSGGRTIYVVRGGSHESPEFGLTCSTDLSRVTGDTLLPTLGFRCCDDDGP